MSRRAVRDRSGPHRHEDRGASLILAIGFVLMVGSIGAGLSALVTSSLANRGALEVVRNREYAADGAIEIAIALVRADARLPLPFCAAPTAPGYLVQALNQSTIRVDWQSACGAVRGADGTIVAQRNVIFSACESTGSACLSGAVIIRAQVNFEQAATGAVTNTYIQTWSVNR
jgi:hypothetical protein